MNEADLRLVPTSRTRVKRLILREPSPLNLSQRRRDESTFGVKKPLSQRPKTDVRAILNTTVDVLRKEEPRDTQLPGSRDLLFVEIQPPMLTKLHISTQFLLVEIDEEEHWMERFGGDIWGVFPVPKTESRDLNIQSRDIESRETQETQEETQEDTQEDPVPPVPPTTARDRLPKQTTTLTPQSRDDLLARAPVAPPTLTPSRASFASLIASLPAPKPTLTPYIPLNLTKPVAAVPLPSVSVSELLLTSYRSQLYCCRTSLIYFAKAMSKSRAMCKSTLEKHTAGSSRVFSASQMRKMSYKLYARELVKLVQPLNEWSQVYEYAEFTKMMSNTTDEHVTTWKESLPFATMSDPEKLSAEISLLKFREMQLQSIVLLELLAVAPATKVDEAAESAKAEKEEKERKKQARKMGLYKSRKSKPEVEVVDTATDYKTMLTHFFSGMCIWQQLSDSGTDHVQEFCKSVVIPYFGSRVPLVVEDLLKRAGLERERREPRVSREQKLSRDSAGPSLSRDSTPRANSPSLSRDSTEALHSDKSNSSSGVSRATRTSSAVARTTMGSLINKPQVRGGLLTSSRSFDKRSQIDMRFKGSFKDTAVSTATQPAPVVVPVTEKVTGMFRKSRDVRETRPITTTTQVEATPVKRTRPILTSFTAEPDNPFVNDSEVADESPFAKRMRGESTGPRRPLGVGLDRSGGRTSASHVTQGSASHVSGNRNDTIMDSPVHRQSSARYSVTMESPTRSRTLGVGQGQGQGQGTFFTGNRGNLFSNKDSNSYSRTVRPSMAAPVAMVAATPKRRTQPMLTNEDYSRQDNPFYNGTDDAVMDTSPSKFVPNTPERGVPETPER